MRRRSGRECKHRGFTMVEVVLSMAIVATLLVAAGAASTTAALQRRRAEDRAAALVLAQDLMNEILGQSYGDPDAGPGTGPSPGEAASGTRANYDDVDDYNGWSASPPQLMDGTPATTTPGFVRSSVVQRVDPLVPNNVVAGDTGLLRITVSVSRNGKPLVTLVALRSVDWPNESS